MFTSFEARWAFWVVSVFSNPIVHLEFSNDHPKISILYFAYAKKRKNYLNRLFVKKGVSIDINAVTFQQSDRVFRIIRVFGVHHDFRRTIHRICVGDRTDHHCSEKFHFPSVFFATFKNEIKIVLLAWARTFWEL